MEKAIKILLIDDDPIANFLHQMLLKKVRSKDEIIVEKNGTTALRFLKECFIKNEECPEIIFLDINMPIMDGFDFLKEFKNIPFKNRDTIQIVALTTSTVPKDIEKMRSFGVSSYINKPLNQEKLLQLIKNHPLLDKERPSHDAFQTSRTNSPNHKNISKDSI